jgi:hypothetical protein
MWRPEADAGRPRSVLHEPARLLTLLACAAIAMGMLMQPYVSGSEFEGTTTRIYLGDVPDAGYVLVLTLLLAALVLSRAATESRDRIVVAAPLVLAALILAVWVQIIRGLMQITDRWLTGGIEFGLWLAGAGAAVAVLAAGWMLVRRWPSTAVERPMSSPSDVATEPVGSGRPGEAVGLLIGGVVGFVIAVGFVTAAVPHGIPLGELIGILVMVVGGAWIGMIVGRRLGLG